MIADVTGLEMDLVVAAPGRKSRSKAGSVHGQQDMDVVGGLLTGVLTWTKNTYAKLKPDGRKCRTCVLTDATGDPVSALATPPIIENCFWGWPPSPDGTTQGCYCGYCRREFVGTVQSSGKTMKDWEADVGKDETTINTHQQKVKLIIETMVKNGSRRCHINWEVVARVSLERVESLQLNIKHPGWRHLGIEAYEAEFENVALAASRGHCRMLVAGVDGVLVPKKDERQIDYNHSISASIAQQFDFGQGDRQSMEDQQLNMRNLMGTGGAELLSGTGAVTGGGPLPSAFPALPAPIAMTAAPSGTPITAPAGALPQAKKSSVGVVVVEPKAKAKKSRTKPPSAPDGHAPPSGVLPAPSAADLKKRGRPQKDLGTEVKSLALEVKGATPQHILFFGSEVKTGLKKFEDLNKTVQARLKKATLESEISELRSYLKFSSAVHAVLSVVATHGMQVQQFADEMDKQDTLLALAPAFPLTWPAHLIWARHRMSIRAVTDADLWATLVSTGELTKRGVAASDIASEQDKLVAEKIVTAFREPAWDACAESLRVTFQTAVEWPFEEDQQDFCAAVAVALHVEEFSQLSDRQACVDEAAEVFDAAIAAKTTCGNALSQWPKGKKLVADVKFDQNCCKVTATLVGSMTTTLASLQGMLDALPIPKGPDDLGGFLQMSDDDFTMLVNLLIGCNAEWNPACDGLLPKFMPDREVLTHANYDLGIALYGAAKSVLHFVLKDTCTPADVASWATTYSTAIQRLLNINGVIGSCAHIISSEQGMVAVVTQRMVDIVRWLLDIVTFMTSDSDVLDVFTCEKLWQSTQTVVMSPVPVINEKDGDWTFQVVEAFRGSPLMSWDGPTINALRVNAFESAGKLLAPIVAAWTATRATMDASTLSFVMLDRDGVDAMSAMAVDDKVFASASKWARDAGDTRLEMQLANVFAMMTMIKALACVESLSRRVVRSDVPFQTSKMSTDAVAQLGTLRGASVALHERCTDECVAAMLPLAVRDPMHCEKLEDAILDYKLAVPNLLGLSKVLQQEFSSLWTRQANELIGHLSNVLPASWNEGQAVLLGHDVLCRQLIANTIGYQRAGGLCTEAVRVLDVCKPLDSFGRRGEFMPKIFSTDTINALKSTCSEVVTMVCHTYFVFHVRREIPTFTSIEKVGISCQDIRTRYKNHKVKLTDDMSDALTGLATGATPAGTYLISADVESPPSVVASPALGSVAPEPNPSPASGSGGPHVAAASAPPTPDVEATTATAPKRARLADRLRHTH